MILKLLFFLHYPILKGAIVTLYLDWNVIFSKLIKVPVESIRKCLVTQINIYWYSNV